MHYRPQLEAIISHAVSQLCHRWFPLICVDHGFDHDDRVDVHQLSFKDWQDYIRMRANSGSDAPWITLAGKQNLSQSGLSTVIFEHLKVLRSQGAQLIDRFHPAYPYLLKHIADAPSAFTALGDLSLLEKSKISIVGSRKASHFAYEQAMILGRGLAAEGWAIVSGGAIGCDAAAHRGALESGILPVPTIVVFAGGLAALHPFCHRDLFRSLGSGGALFLSERLWEYPAFPYDFPVRNRIIAGLSSDLILAQAAARSGALKTALYALEQGREVHVLVHEAEDVRAEGSQKLLEEGAWPLHDARDFIRTKVLEIGQRP